MWCLIVSIPDLCPLSYMDRQIWGESGNRWEMDRQLLGELGIREEMNRQVSVDLVNRL